MCIWLIIILFLKALYNQIDCYFIEEDDDVTLTATSTSQSTMFLNTKSSLWSAEPTNCSKLVFESDRKERRDHAGRSALTWERSRGLGLKFASGEEERNGHDNLAISLVWLQIVKKNKRQKKKN